RAFFGLLLGQGGLALGRPLQKVFGDVSHEPSPRVLATPATAERSPALRERWARGYSGPLIPPSFLTLQKWMAMKMTITNGNMSTWSTYHRNRVSVLISTPPNKTKRTWEPNTGV